MSNSQLHILMRTLYCLKIWHP